MCNLRMLGWLQAIALRSRTTLGCTKSYAAGEAAVEATTPGFQPTLVFMSPKEQPNQHIDVDKWTNTMYENKD